MPILEPMARPNRAAMNQKCDSERMIRRFLKLGLFPRNLPPALKMAKIIPAARYARPILQRQSLQVQKWSMNSAIRGAETKPRFGASSWMAMALPQFLTRTASVSDAMPEGRYKPADMPRHKRARCISVKVRLPATAMRERPTARADATIICLCVSRIDKKPDPRSVAQYPKEIEKKSNLLRRDGRPGLLRWAA
jgi:hypothetical protein